MTFNAALTFYILNSQDRRFAQVDAQAKAALQQVSQEMRGSVHDALSFGKMFSGAFGGGKRGSGSPTAPPPVADASGGGGFSSQTETPESSGQSAWPSGGGGGGGA